MNNFAKDFALAEQEINELNETIAKMQIVIDEQQKMINELRNTIKN
jgi:uncharacterized coiled-coil protein SlyX